jgi:preprotein translocase subunit SecF
VNLARQLYRGGTSFDILRYSTRILLVSAVVVVVCIASLLWRGLNLGIEFEGGVVWEVPSNEASEEDMREVLADFDVPEARVQSVGGEIFRIRAEAGDPGQQAEVTAALAERVGAQVGDVSVSEVGPSWGDEITSAAQRALIVFIIVITLYLAIRLEWKMAIVTVVALLHDLVVTVGTYSIFQIEVTPATVVAFLTIMGYSLYDGIVVFDRVRENSRLLPTRGRTTYRSVVNLSLNQVLMRSINTSFTALLPVATLLAVATLSLGAAALREFAVALGIGMLVGAYSSLFVATPLLIPLKEREAEWALRRRTAETTGGEGTSDLAQTMAASQYSRSTPPRPRKRARRR